MSALSRFLPVIAISLLVAGVGIAMLFRGRAAVVYNIPASIAADCSRNVQVEITDFIKTVPDGSTIQFPVNGCYAQNDYVEVMQRSNLVIDGAGSVFKNSAVNDPNTRAWHGNWIIAKARNVTIRNVTTEGNFKSAGPRQFPAGNQFNHGIFVKGGDGTNIEDITVRDVWGDGVSTARGDALTDNVLQGEIPRNIHIQRLKISRTARMCVGITEGVGVWLEDSSCTNIFYGGVDAEIDVAGQSIKDLHVLRNSFDGVYVSAISVPQKGTTGSVDGIEIRGNQILSPPDTCFPAIMMTYTEGPFAYDPSQTMANVVTEDNDIHTLGDGIRYRDVSSGSVRNNRVTRTVTPGWCGSPDTTTPAAPAEDVKLINSPNITVSNNGPNVTPNLGSPSSPPTPNPNPTPAPAPTPAPTPSPPSGSIGQTMWNDGTATVHSGDGTAINAKASGAVPNVVYYLYSGHNGCTTDMRDMQAGAIVSDGNGNIGVLNGRVVDGTTLRPQGTYDICFLRGDASSHTDPLSYRVAAAPSNPTPAPTSSKVGDLNNDGKVNIFDLSILLSHWNTSNSTGDLNKDDRVNIFDLSILLSKYGS
ncbi:MAG TPA: dockerin type I domain-containing protein [Candidatus Limnocylindrales bacterium]|nr:dockerin type I domain-containing protein [Candidatus Limnocylindrales bacterium]